MKASNSFLIFIILIISLGYLACSKEDDTVNDGMDSILLLEVRDTILPADGISYTVLTATIPTGEEIDHSDIHFSVSKGSLQLPGEPTKSSSISTTAGPTKKVSVYFYSDTIPGDAIISAYVHDPKYQREKVIHIQKLEEYYKLQELTVELSDTVLPADNGKSSFLIIARIKNVPLPSLITISTSKGKFVNPDNSLSKSVSLLTDINGFASVRLLTDSTAGTVFLSFFSNHSRIDTSVTLKELPVDNTLSLTIDVNDTAIMASNAQTYCIVSAKMTSKSLPTLLNFSTTKGKFLNTSSMLVSQLSVQTDLNGFANVRLFADSIPGKAFITVSSNQLRADTSVHFIP